MIAGIKRLFGEEFNTLLLLNLITAALFLPVVTVGPAILALNGTLIRILDDDCDCSRVKEYWALFKKKFGKGVLLELVFAGYGAMLLWCASLASHLGEHGVLLWGVTVLMGFLAALVAVCVCQILSAVQIGFGAALWNGICMAIGRFPQVLLSALCTYGVLLISYLLYPVSLLPLAIIMLSCMAALSVSALWNTLQKLVLNQ